MKIAEEGMPVVRREVNLVVWEWEGGEGGNGEVR